ncbi:MAG: hypothetical protein ANABAC_1233 [Anaerolineae bacterium]|nr:MAG: hypothetical protein ANABAC_1233 [Anaerolineae bacterium]
MVGLSTNRTQQLKLHLCRETMEVDRAGWAALPPYMPFCFRV